MITHLKAFLLMEFVEILSGINITDYFASYFTFPQGAVPWQYEKVLS
jgi:uncharacterized membrane protein